MEEHGSWPLSFVIRIQRQGAGFRGHVIDVGSGQGRIVTSLAEAAAFIESRIGGLPYRSGQTQDRAEDQYLAVPTGYGEDDGAPGGT